jgi:hypothetical protein
MKQTGEATHACPHCGGALRLTLQPIKAEADAATADWLQTEWNARKHATQIGSRGAMNPSLKAQARKRCAEIPSKADWRTIIDRIAGSPYHRGENDRQWRADFHYLVRTQTGARTLEAARHAQTSGGASAVTTADGARTDMRARNAAAVGQEPMFRPGDDA